MGGGGVRLPLLQAAQMSDKLTRYVNTIIYLDCTLTGLSGRIRDKISAKLFIG